MKQGTKTILVKSVVGLLCAVTIALCGLFMYNRSKVVYFTAIITVALSAVTYCALDESKYKHASRTVLVVAILAALIVV